jgi:hypothetical protein
MLPDQRVAAVADAPASAKNGDIATTADGKPAAAERPPGLDAPLAGKAVGQERRPATVLPAPLENVACNVSKLEESGQLALTGVVFGWSEDFGDEALIWTVKVLKPMTCRHAQLLLRRYSDVRFYDAGEKSQRVLFSGALCYSPRIAEGAVHGDLLHQDTKFQVWVPLTSSQAYLLARQRVAYLVVHEPQTLRVRPLDVSSTQWNVAASKIPRWFTAKQKQDRLSE